MRSALCSGRQDTRGNGGQKVWGNEGAVLATAMSLGGVPAYREACEALEDFLKTL